MQRRHDCGWQILVACACVCVAVVTMACEARANGQRTRPSGWPQTGAVALPGLGYDRNAQKAYPTHRPSGCAQGHDCIECVAGCRPPGQRIVAQVARTGPVSDWQRVRHVRRDPNTVIACYEGGCTGQGYGRLSHSLDVNITVHSYRSGW